MRKMRFLLEKRQVLPVSVHGCNTVQLLRLGINTQRGTDGQLMLVMIQPYADANTEQCYATRGTDEFAQPQIETGGRVDLPNLFCLS